MNAIKPLYQKLADYILKFGLNGKKIADKFNYSEGAISKYLNGKSADTKLDVVVDLFLQLEELKDSGLTNDKRKELEKEIEDFKLKCARYEGEIIALKSVMKDFQNISSLNIAELTAELKNTVNELDEDEKETLRSGLQVFKERAKKAEERIKELQALLHSKQSNLQGYP